MIQLDEVVDILDLQSAKDGGYINERVHPDFPEIRILNYSDKCQYEGIWNTTTMSCRGLIYNSNTMEVLARPIKKFFNYGQSGAPVIFPNARIQAFDKIDGSLGILFMNPDGNLDIATRGSFESEQANHARAWLKMNDQDSIDLSNMAYSFVKNGVFTPLVEIIYPENRIVLDYGQSDTLVYLGCVGKTSGAFRPADALALPAKSLTEALEAAPRANAEGMVIWMDPWNAIKIKQEDYVALHRVVSNLSQKEIWRQLRAGTYGTWVQALPDEFQEWADDNSRTILENFWDIQDESNWYYEESKKLDTRKDQAIYLQSNCPRSLIGVVFSMLDQKDWSDAIYKLIEPKGIVSIRNL